MSERAHPIHARVVERNLARRKFTKNLQRACADHHVTAIEVLGKSRRKNAAAARRQIWQEMHEAGLSMNEIARIFGMNHSTVIYQTERRPGANPQRKTLEQRVSELEETVKALSSELTMVRSLFEKGI